MEPFPEFFYQLQMFSTQHSMAPIAKQNSHKDSGTEGNRIHKKLHTKGFKNAPSVCVKEKPFSTVFFLLKQS